MMLQSGKSYTGIIASGGYASGAYHIIPDGKSLEEKLRMMEAASPRREIHCPHCAKQITLEASTPIPIDLRATAANFYGA